MLKAAWFNCGRLKVTLLAATMRSFSFVTAAQNRRYSFAVVSSGPRECNPALNHALKAHINAVENSLLQTSRIPANMRR
jgi:hypothetical protein